MTDDDIRNLPASVETLSLGFSNYVTDLSSLPETCPNLKNLSLNSCSGITDLSFIYRLHSLEKVTLNDIAGVSQELLDYLKSQGIEFYITEDDVVASEMIPQILDQIIEDGMTDEEKIQAIALYVSRHCKYKLFSADQSNEDPLSTTLLDGKGVCAGIAYTTNVLLRSAGINSYEAVSNSHAWNLVELDGKYYYLDAVATHNCR